MTNKVIKKIYMESTLQKLQGVCNMKVRQMQFGSIYKICLKILNIEKDQLEKKWKTK